MEILSWIIVGLITGSMARAIMPGPAAGGLRNAILIGIIGTFVGGSVGTIFPIDQSAQFNFYALLMATNGALYLLFAYRCIAMRTTRIDKMAIAKFRAEHTSRFRMARQAVDTSPEQLGAT